MEIKLDKDDIAVLEDDICKQVMVEEEAKLAAVDKAGTVGGNSSSDDDDD